MNYWIETFSGNKFDYENIEDNKPNIIDIAHALSNLCRFNGHSSQFYSVAEHSILVADEIKKRYPTDNNFILKALLHDATETYMPDIPRPLKIFWSEQFKLRNFEDRITDCVYKQFGLKEVDNEELEIKIFDTAVLRAERKAFFKKKILWRFPKGIPIVNPKIIGFSPIEVEEKFITYFNKLYNP